VFDFEKYHALGNDYLIIDPVAADVPATTNAARALCDRHFGVGSDGVLFGSVEDAVPGDAIPLLIFNADGSVCEKSGNGLGMFALYLAEHGVGGDCFVIRTLAGNTVVRVVDAARGLVSVDMGAPTFDGMGGNGVRSTLTVDGRNLTVVRVHNGNPHVVVLLPEVPALLIHELGPLIAGHPEFPDRVNVEFLRVLDPGTLDIEVWERGAGYTLAAGSSSCAAASAAHALGFVADAVSVRMPGGTHDIAIGPDGVVTMTGTAEKIMNGTLSTSLRRRLALRGMVTR
jgi:diaminopimelate epimerase